MTRLATFFSILSLLFFLAIPSILFAQETAEKPEASETQEGAEDQEISETIDDALDSDNPEESMKDIKSEEDLNAAIEAIDEKLKSAEAGSEEAEKLNKLKLGLSLKRDLAATDKKIENSNCPGGV